jgi:ring-1,2-phenylacetyl-CoA epoxidase subunit PaaA
MTTPFTDKVEYADFPKMPQEYRDIVLRLLLAHAEGELTGSDMYTLQFFPLAPNAYERYICCLRAAEEVDHYVKTAQVLTELGVDTSHMVHQAVMERNYYPLEAVRFQFSTWEDRGVFSALAEYVGHYQIENMAEASFQPLARICPGILKEEAGHAAHGWRIVKQLSQTPEGHQKVQEAVDRWYPIALDAFGRSDSKRSELYLKWGIKKKANEELRQEFMQDVVPRLAALGLKAPEPHLNRKFV